MGLNEHYGRLLGLDENWGVTDVALDLGGNKVGIFIEYRAKAGICPECGRLCGVHDRLAERTWRHLDTLLFEAFAVTVILFFRGRLDMRPDTMM